MSETPEHIRCLIVGSGPAGYTAAIYAARADLKPVIYTGIQPGGQLTTTTEVENYPGYPDGTQGTEMMEDFRKQAERFDADVRFGYVSNVELSERTNKVTIDESTQVITDVIIVATGASAKWLGLEPEKTYNVFGASTCEVYDGYYFQGQDCA